VVPSDAFLHTRSFVLLFPNRSPVLVYKTLFSLLPAVLCGYL